MKHIIPNLTWPRFLLNARSSIRSLSPGALAVTLLLAVAADARAGLSFELHIYRSNQGQLYNFYTPLSTNTMLPDAQLGVYTISSPQWPDSGSMRQFELTADGLNLTAGEEHWTYGDFDTVMQQITNGTWTILFTNATTTNLYTFTVSAPSMTSNMLPATVIGFPSDGALVPTNQPTFTWQGASDWPVNANAYVWNSDYSFFQYASLAPSQSAWTLSTPIPDGADYSLELQYVTNSADIFLTTTPLSTNSSHQAISGWASTAALETSGSVSFAVTNAAAVAGGGHRLVAHYAFDDSGNLGQDSSGNGNDMLNSSTWGPVHEFNSDAAAGGGAVQFFGTSSMTPDDTTRSNWDLTLAGSFSISAWVKTTASRGNDYDNAYFGATIFWAYNDSGNVNDTIPLAITGSKAAFTTRGEDSGNFTTLHSGTSVTDGAYHLITVTRDQASGEKKMYVDGNFEASEIGTTDPLNGNDYYLSIGGTTDSSYTGLLDDVQIYAGVLSAGEVAALYGNPGSTAPNAASGSLAAHYDFDEGTVLAPDVSGNGNNIVYAGNFGGSGPAISTDTIAGAGSVYFDGGSYLTAPSNLLSTIARDFSISVWVQTSQDVGSPGDMAYWGAVIVSADLVTGGVGDAVPLALTDGQVAFNTGDGFTDQTLNSSATVNDGAWHHVVVTRSQATGEKQIYIDGALDNSETGTTVLLDGPQLLTIGAKSDASDPDPASPDSNGSQGYEGLLDDLQIYSRVLDAGEVAYLYGNPGATVSGAAPAPYPVDLTLSLRIVRRQELDGTETYTSFPSFDSISPAATTTNFLTSPHGGFLAESDPSSGYTSSWITTSLGDVLNEMTNGLWTLYINQSSPTQQVYTFSISVSGLDTGVLGAASILSPANGSVNVATNPSFYWSGPASFSSMLVGVQGGASAFLPVTTTNWPSPPALNYGTNEFDLSYYYGNFPNVTFTTPVDAAANPIRTWAAQAILQSSASASFVVGAPAPLPVQLTDITPANGSVQFSFASLAGRSHTIQARTNLTAGAWLDLTNFVGDGSLRQFSFPTTNPPIRFFRVKTD